MMNLIHFIFSSFWVFIGFLIILETVCMTIFYIIYPDIFIRKLEIEAVEGYIENRRRII